MDIRIQSIHFDASEQLQAFIQKKVSKLEKYYEDIKKVEVSYNDPLGYADLILNGDPKEYLKNVSGSRTLEN